MYAQIQNIAIPIDQFYGFLGFALHLDLLQAPKGSDTVIDMGHIIPDLPLGEFFDAHGLFFGQTVFEFELVVAFKNFVICVTGDALIVIHKALMKREDLDTIAFDVLGAVLKNISKSFGLRLGTTAKNRGHPLAMTRIYMINQQIKLLVERGLRTLIKTKVWSIMAFWN